MFDGFFEHTRRQTVWDFIHAHRFESLPSHLGTELDLYELINGVSLAATEAAMGRVSGAVRQATWNAPLKVTFWVALVLGYWQTDFKFVLG